VQETTKKRLRAPLQPIVSLLTSLKVAPNAVTVAGLLFAGIAGGLLSRGLFIGGGVALLIAGLADSVDGELARRSNRTHPMGAFLDSSFDRIAEFAVFFGLFWFYRSNPGMAALIFATLFASVAVSYVRARAEGVGARCNVGLFERPVRFLFTVLGIFISHFYPIVLTICLWIILVGSTFTVVQRFVYVLRGAERKNGS